MGYLFLIFALLFGLIKAYCGKKSALSLVHPSDAFVVNTIRMVMCLIIGIIMALLNGENVLFFIDRQTILISLLSGISMGAFVVCWFLCVSNTAYMVVEVFVMSGVVVPLILCVIFYKEHIGAVQLMGISMLLVAVYCMCTYGKTEKIEISLKEIIILGICALSSGMTDFSQKLYIKEVKNASIIIFNLYTYFFADMIFYFY